MGLQDDRNKVGIVALTRDEIALVQRSMLGSTLCYALLVSFIHCFGNINIHSFITKDHGLMLLVPWSSV